MNKKFLKKKVNVFGKGVPVLAIFVLGIALVSAALISYFGVITGSVIVGQGLFVDGKAWDVPITYEEDFTSLEAKTVSSDVHVLTNDATVDAIVTLDTVCTPAGDGCDEVTPTIEYKLDATTDDDALFVVLDSPIVWSDFTGATFDYVIESDGGNLWIPQMNVKLVDDTGDLKYYASWHSFRTGVNGVVGVEASETFDKDGFYLYRTDNWALLGLWSDTQWIRDSHTSLTDLYTQAETDALKDEINPLQFDKFTRQAGDTSDDPNEGIDEQIVWLSNFAMNTGTIKGIKVPLAEAYDPALQLVEFKIVTDFPQMMIPDTLLLKS